MHSLARLALWRVVEGIGGETGWYSFPAAWARVRRAPPPAEDRIGGMRTALIAGAAVLIVVLIFIIQNAHAVNITFLGAHLACRWPWRCCSPSSPAR